MKTAIVTGAAGFLGSHAVERLLADGYKVRAFDLDRARAETALAAVAGDPNLSFEPLDVLDMEATDQRFAGAAFVFHCAGIADHVQSLKMPEKYLRVHVSPLARVLEAARHHGVEKVIYPSSAAVYGRAEWPTREDHPIRPESPYGLSKWMGEELIESWRRIFGVPGLSFRIFNGYGPRAEAGSVINFFIKKKLAGEPLTLTGDGSQRRDFIYVTDIVDAFVRGAESDVTGQTFNLASGTLHTVLDMARLIGGRIEFIPKRANDPETICPDISRIRAAFGWQARVSLDEGVRKTMKSYGL